MYCVVLNPVDAFLNRKAKSGVRKIEVAELGTQHSNTIQVSYHRRHDIPAVSSGRWMAGVVLGSRKAAPPFPSYTAPAATLLSCLVLSRVLPEILRRGLQQSPD